MAITASTGIGSGIDINGLVNSIVSAEGTPVQNRLDIREAELQAKLSAYGSLKGALSAFQTSLVSLQTASSFNQKSTTTSDDTIVTASATSSVAAGTYDLTIANRAASHKLALDTAYAAFTSESEILGTGSLTFKFGTTTLDDPSPGDYTFVQNADKATETVEITDGSLKGIRDAVNDANIGVTASIVFDGTNQILTFTADSGTKNSMAITVADDDLGAINDNVGLSRLNYDGQSNGQSMIQNDAGLDASFSLNGVTVSSETNTITTAIDGLTFNLLDDTGSATLTVEKDTSYTSTNISSFVTKYNALMSTINDLSKYNPDTGVAGTLNGDGVLRNITSQLRSTLGNSIANISGSYTILAEVGITTSSTDGTLVLDDSKLDAAMSSNLDNVMQLFAAIGTSTDSFVEYTSSTDNTLVGSYDINITQLATQGKYVGSKAVTSETITAGSNDSLTLSVDGVATTITLGAGTYSAAELATELQSRINGADELADAGLSVSVTQSGGVLTIISNSYGSDSTVSISGEAATITTLFTSGASTTGKDVAGTIGGYEATGEGQYLIGEQAAVDLKIKIEGTTTGDRGTVTFTHGYAKQLDDILTELLDTDGLFTTVTDGVQGRIDSITTQREELARRLTSIEARVRAKFIAMDAIVATLRSTSDFLTQQLASLPKITVRGSK